jgi:hypothetical protein
MANQEEIRAKIIADQAEREARSMTPAEAREKLKKKSRTNWAASPPLAPPRRWAVRGPAPANK